MKKEFLSKFFPTIFCLFFLDLRRHGAADLYPKYMGEDCSAEGYGEYGLTGIPEVDEFCSHIVCEGRGLLRSLTTTRFTTLRPWTIRGQKSSPAG